MEDYTSNIKNSWEQFVYNDIIDETIRKDILESWIRCKKYGVSPMGGKGKNKNNDIKALIERNLELINVAKSVMESIYKIVEGSGFAIILSDKEGYILEVIGDKDIMERVNELNFLRGELWSEEAVGTNAIGTALYLNKPMQTIGAEHFGSDQHSWTCSASPIYDEDRNVIGCINMAGNYYDAHSHTLGIVTSAAESIQKQLALSNSYNLLNITFNSISDGMIVIDSFSSIKRINGRAMEILGLTLEETINLDIKNFITNIDFKSLLKETGKEIHNRECDLKGKNKNIKCIISVVPMKSNNKNIGIVITFKEIKYVHKLVSKLAGFKASYTFDDIVTRNDKMISMIKFAEKVAKSDCNVLIEGESGTGKELIAQSLHNGSKRKNGPFVAVNCASIPRELVESELFGYEKGAFTGATKEGHAGKFEIADGGTIFLDEIGELPLDMQSKLLRVLDNGKIVRVGGTFEKQLDVRVIGATNRILKKEVLNKNFRSDLYYRLSVMNIKTLPLRERKEDIELLVNHFTQSLSIKSGENLKQISSDYIEILKNNYWDGNVRELRNVVERDYYLSEDNILNSYQIEELKKTEDLEVETVYENNEVLSMEILEKREIQKAIEKTNGNMVKVAKLLNIGRATLYRKIKKYNIVYKN
ncbi:PAS domain S-box-containing protein [Clostridium cavendishii DSM 21758]|uniref:PAS domain S-box-containing protein n=1 Tax=Clostridium cavendishii DSM 21758 TaxID=1121302 RepID=A0A1M6NF04_9CLOT|nr:sigma 54-interacting transcriptional regulator [Clostridium cavendishii]SHJ94282.1 PAS domain S-box-containing protein [Clostridium cavendishii DSM 21758]